MFRPKSRGPSCPDCGSQDLETADSGQVTCLGCGYVISGAQHVSETQDFDETKMVNMRMVRTTKSSTGKKNKDKLSGKQRQQARRVEDDLANRTQAFEMVEKTGERLIQLGFVELDMTQARLDLAKLLPKEEPGLTAGSILKRVFGVLYLNMNEPTMTTWDLGHLALVGAVPNIEYGAIELGPAPQAIKKVTDLFEDRQKPNLDYRAITMRYAVRLSKLLKFPYPQSLWRVAWIVLFGLGGWNGRLEEEGASIAAGVIASVVLLDGWQERVLALTREEIESFSFSPYGDFYPGANLLEKSHRSRRIRMHHFRHQRSVIESLGPSLVGAGFISKSTDEAVSQKPGVLNAHFQQIFEKRLASIRSEATEDDGLPIGGCDGICLEEIRRTSNPRANKLNAYNSFMELNLWRKHQKKSIPLYIDRALNILLEVGSRGIDFYLQRETSGKRRDLILDVRSVVATATRFEAGDTIEDFFVDTSRIAGLGCRGILCCPRVFRVRAHTKRWNELFVNDAFRPCGECVACQLKEDCKKCAACLDRPEHGGVATDHELRPCLRRICARYPYLSSKRQRQARHDEDATIVDLEDRNTLIQHTDEDQDDEDDDEQRTLPAHRQLSTSGGESDNDDEDESD